MLAWGPAQQAQAAPITFYSAEVAGTLSDTIFPVDFLTGPGEPDPGWDGSFSQLYSGSPPPLLAVDPGGSFTGQIDFTFNPLNGRFGLSCVFDQYTFSNYCPVEPSTVDVTFVKDTSGAVTEILALLGETSQATSVRLSASGGQIERENDAVFSGALGGIGWANDWGIRLIHDFTVTDLNVAPFDPIFGDVQTHVIPLPASLPLVLAGLGLLGLASRRRKSAQHHAIL